MLQEVIDISFKDYFQESEKCISEKKKLIDFYKTCLENYPKNLVLVTLEVYFIETICWPFAYLILNSAKKGYKAQTTPLIYL